MIAPQDPPSLNRELLTLATPTPPNKMNVVMQNHLLLLRPRHPTGPCPPAPLKDMGVDQNYGPFWGLYYRIFLIV